MRNKDDPLNKITDTGQTGVLTSPEPNITWKDSGMLYISGLTSRLCEQSSEGFTVYHT